MESKCGKYWQAGLPCPTRQPTCALAEQPTAQAPVHCDRASPRGIAFGVDPHAQGNVGGKVPIPGYDAPALPIKPTRDPSLSLIALSGVEPSGPVMVEVPLVLNNSTFKAVPALSGRRVGFAERFAGGSDSEPITHSPCFLRALQVLRLAGVQLVPVPAHRADGIRHDRNEIDDLVREYWLDALVSDSQSGAFHGACRTGYPVLGEPLGNGATLWFYGAQWAKDSLATLVQGYRSAFGLMGPQDGLPVALSNPTQ